jgi:RHS repeat-associated protein
MPTLEKTYLTPCDTWELRYGPEDHLGSTRVVIDGEAPEIGSQSFTAQEQTFYYSYGKMHEFGIAPVNTREKFTGKEFDEEAEMGLFYFGRRYYDPEIGVWTGTDRAGQYQNKYSYTGGNPVCMVDPDGNVAIYVNGVNGNDDPELRQRMAANDPLFGGSSIGNKQASFYGHDYGVLRALGANDTWNQLGDLAIAAGGFGGIFAPQLQIDYEKAYWESVRRGEPFYVVGHSGGAGAAGMATGLFNLTHGYGTVSHQYNINGADAGGWGTASAELTGTQVTSYYTITDPVSHYGALWDLTNPVTLAIDPGKNLQTLDPFQWGSGNFSDGTFFGHNGGSGSAFSSFQDFGNVFTGETVGSKMLQGAGIYGLVTGDFTMAASLLGNHYGIKILREVTWYANPLNWFR